MEAETRKAQPVATSRAAVVAAPAPATQVREDGSTSAHSSQVVFDWADGYTSLQSVRQHVDLVSLMKMELHIMLVSLGAVAKHFGICVSHAVFLNVSRAL
mmetsp:Transcript_21657/g.38266  ORF Transcript_21657/g.38266 Transcript_21657/m.38266 type:complete len:100 (-) Transcript_21657:92-391(-)